MSEDFVVNAEVREDAGKGASRRLRKTNRVPAILYGGHKDPVMLSLKGNEVVKHLATEAFYSHILTIDVDGNKEKAVVKDVQRHPAREEAMHLDFQRVSADEKLHMQVPLHFLNEETCPGVKAGGMVSHSITEVAITCLPKDLPEYIELDMGEMEANASLHLSDLKLPEGVEIPELAHGAEHDHVVVAIHIRTGGDEPEEEAGDAAAADGEGASAEE